VAVGLAVALLPTLGEEALEDRGLMASEGGMRHIEGPALCVDIPLPGWDNAWTDRGG
jgi:hypothetical protein